MPVRIAFFLIFINLQAADLVRLLDNGPDSNRVIMVYVAEGFAREDHDDGIFKDVVDTAYRYKFYHDKFSIPYPRYRNFINVFRLDIISPESGIDNFTGEDSVFVDTPFDGKAIPGRLGVVSNSKVNDTLKTYFDPLGVNAHWKYAVLNSDGYYNSGGGICVFSNNHNKDIALHEGGHTFHRLADEYGGNKTYTGSEPNSINVTADISLGKWDRWVGYNQDILGVHDYYEGGYYADFGIWKPTEHSKMNLAWDRPFNMIGVEKIIHDIYKLVNPVDAFSDTAGLQDNPEEFHVLLVDSSVTKIDWYVDDILTMEMGPHTIWVSDVISEPGDHVIEARIYDEAAVHAFSDNSDPHTLDLVRKDLHLLRDTLTWYFYTDQVSTSGADLESVMDMKMAGKQMNLRVTRPMKISLEIYDVKGKRIFVKDQISIYRGNNTISLNRLGNGAYTFSIRSHSLTKNGRMMIME